jgi:hypothetical protein
MTAASASAEIKHVLHFMEQNREQVDASKSVTAEVGLKTAVTGNCEFCVVCRSRIDKPSVPRVVTSR